MSKTSFDFGFFCDINQNLKDRCFLADLLGSRSLLQRVQKVMVCDLRLVDFDPFSVCLMLLNFRVRVFLKGAISFSSLCLVDREDLGFDVLCVTETFYVLALKFNCF